MIGQFRFLLSGLGILIACAGYATGHQPDGAKAPATSSEKKEERVRINYSELVHNDGTGVGEAKKIQLVDDETLVLADNGKWNDKTKLAEATGHLKMTDPKADGTGEKALVYYGKSKKILIMTGNVEISVKPRKDKEKTDVKPPSGPAPVVLEGTKAVTKTDEQDDEESPRKFPALITCDKVEYQYAKDKKHAILTGHFKVVQKLPMKTRTLIAEHAEWYGIEEKIILFGPVHWEDTKGSKGDSVKEVTVFTGDGNEKLISAEGTAELRVDDEADAPKPGDKTTPPDKKKKQ